MENNVQCVDDSRIYPCIDLKTITLSQGSETKAKIITLAILKWKCPD